MNLPPLDPFAALNSLSLLWVFAVFAGGLVTLWIFQRALRRAAEWRLQRLKRREIREVAPAQVEAQADGATLEQVAKQSIENQFTVTRRLVRPLILALTLILALLPFLDYFPAAMLSLLIGAATVVLGIASRPVIENAVAGLVISYSRTLNLGDTVKLDGHYGTVEDIGLTHTTIKLWDWRRYVLPNSQMVASKFLNYTLLDHWVWSYVEFWVSHDADLEEVEKLAVEACQNQPTLATTDDIPRFWVMEMSKEGVRCWVAGWAANPADAWNLSAGTRKLLTGSLHRAGIRSHAFHHSLGEGDWPGSPGSQTHP